MVRDKSPLECPLGRLWECGIVKVLPIPNVASTQYIRCSLGVGRLVLGIDYWQQFHIGKILQCRQAMGGGNPRRFSAVICGFMDGVCAHVLSLARIIP